MTLSQLLGTVSELISSYFQMKKEKTSVAVKFTEMGMIAGQTAKTVGEKVTVVEKWLSDAVASEEKWQSVILDRSIYHRK